MDNDDATGPRSLYALVYYGDTGPGGGGRHYGILDLHHVHQKTKKEEVDEKVCFNLPRDLKKWTCWTFSSPQTSCCTKDLSLYMLPYRLSSRKPFQGFKLDIRTGSLAPIKLPDSYDYLGSFLNLEPHIYYVSRVLNYDGCVFQRYDPVKNSWKGLVPFREFPVDKDAYQDDGIAGLIVATAAWVDSDTILLNVDISGVRSMWAYVVSRKIKRNKWYPVEVDNYECKLIQGEAVVIGNIIYALTPLKVVALSIEKEGIDNHLVFKCSLLWDKYVKPILCPNPEDFRITRHLVHLGKDMFCFVQSADCVIEDDCGIYQPIQLTYIMIKRDNRGAIVTDTYFHHVKIQHTGYFQVQLCFSLPKGALKEGKSFNLDTYSKDFEGRKIVTLDNDDTSQLDNDSSERNTIDEEADRSRRSVYVKLPHNASVRHLKKRLMKFGPIKSDGFRLGKDEEGNRVAHVEFESHSAKKRVIEESSIRIRGKSCLAEITEKRLTCSLALGPGDCNRTQEEVVSRKKKKIKI